MQKMKAMQIKEAGGDFQSVELPVPDPHRDEVRVKVEACGICHSDAFVKEGLWPDLEYPRVPGHEIVGTIDAVGDGVDQWQPGERVGIGWHGGHCFQCTPCREGDFVACENGKVTGISFDGGYAEYMKVPTSALARVPKELESTDAAPILCAGITTYNSLRNSGARPADPVAILGIGGLGHLGVQYANKLGFRTIAMSRGSDKDSLARELGADEYIDTDAGDPAEELQKMGGARVILATAPNARAIQSAMGGLGRNGRLIIVGVAEKPIEVDSLDLISGRKSVGGWPSGDAKESEETLEFSALRDIRARVETYPLSEAAAAYDRMIRNEARFRVVLTPNG